MQQIALEDKKGSAARALEDMKQRISAMGRVHRMLYLSENFSEIDFSEYIKSLIDEIKVTYAADRTRIDIITDLDPVTFNIDMAIPCGLLINELLVNAFRHAFPDRKTGRITVSLKKKVKALELKVEYNGIGMPGDPLAQKGKTLGLKLVAMLSKQLKSKASYKGQKGSLFTIVFKSDIMKPIKKG